MSDRLRGAAQVLLMLLVGILAVFTPRAAFAQNGPVLVVGAPQFASHNVDVSDKIFCTGQFTNVDFTNYNAADVQFYILHPGAAATTYFMGPLTFANKPTMGVGYYVKAEDSDAAAPVLQVDLGFFFIGTDIPDPAPDLFDDFFQEVDGAQLFYSWS